jgi:hypothetical protein
MRTHTEDIWTYIVGSRRSKSKIKLSYYHHANDKVHRKYSSYLFLTWAPWPHFTPGARMPGTHWIGGQVGIRAGLNTEARGKIFFLFCGLNCGHSVVQSVVKTLYCLSYPNSRK